MANEKPKLPEDRTELGEKWAAVIAEIDDLRAQLAAAEKLEAEIWDALERSRAKSVRSSDD